MLLGVATLIGVYKLGMWFLSPYIIDKQDRSASPIRSYKLNYPPSSTNTSSPSSNTPTSTTFPSIRDKASKSISLIFPAYNEEERLRACLDPTIQYLTDRERVDHKCTDSKSSRPFSWEIIVVNDGSKDSTAQIVLEYTEKHGMDRVRLLDYGLNQGKGFAVQQVICSFFEGH